MLPKPCHCAPGRSTQHDGSLASSSAGRVVERQRAARARLEHRVGLPAFEEPVAFRAEFAVHPRDHLPERDGFLDRFVRQRRAAGAVHHRRRDVVRRDDRVVRRRRRVHHERFVKLAMRDRAAAVAHVDVRRLRQRGQQLVRRLRREHRGPVGTMVARVAVHRMAVAVDRVETRVAVPRFVEVQAVDARAEQFFHARDVVAEAVVRRVRDDRVLRLAIGQPGRERVRRDRLANRRLRETLGRDRPDDPVAVARRHEVGRNRARHRHRVLGGLVTVAVAQRDLVAAHARHQDDAVGRRRAVRHVIRAMRAEHARRVTFAFADRARVIEQRAEFADRDRQVRAEQRFAEVFEERAADRRFQEARATRMAGRMPRVLVNARELRERAEHRRQHVRAIAFDRRVDAPADEVGRILEQPHEIVDLPHHRGRHRRRHAAVGQQEDRHVAVALPDRVDHGLGRPVAVHAEIPVEQHALDRRIGTDQHERIVGGGRREHVDVALHEFRAQRTDCPPGRRFLRDLVVDQQRAHAEPTNATGRSIHDVALAVPMLRLLCCSSHEHANSRLRSAAQDARNSGLIRHPIRSRLCHR